jgi:protein-S-isoprenylcysteine O-methyltransferase Ste14
VARDGRRSRQHCCDRRRLRGRLRCADGTCRRPAIAGVVLRIVAFRTLGASYSRTLRVTEQQALVTRGVYRRVRHPGYASAILIWGGAAIASGVVAAAAVAGVVLVGVYLYRIGAEERMLARAFGAEYEAYRARSWRLVPYVY